MKEIEAHARKCGLRPVSIWSINNPEHDMTDEQIAARESILNECTLPPQYNFLIINAASETSLKIKSPVDYVIVHSVDTDTQIQVRGRVNHDIKAIYIPENDYSAIVPPEGFLNTLLFKADTDKLCEIINVRNECGRLCKWTTVKKALAQNGYTVVPARKGNYRGYTIIFPSIVPACSHMVQQLPVSVLKIARKCPVVNTLEWCIIVVRKGGETHGSQGIGTDRGILEATKSAIAHGK